MDLRERLQQALALAEAGRADESAALLRDVLTIDPGFLLGKVWLGSTYLGQGRLADAVPLFERSIDPSVRHSVDVAFLDRRSNGYVSPASIALPNAGLGDTVEAFAWLRRAAEIHDPFLVYIFVVEPLLEPLKRDPRGVAILREMGLVKGR